MTSKYLMKLNHIVMAIALEGASSLPVSANEESGGFFGNLRIGFITAEDDAGDNTDGSAYGGKLGYISPRWNGLSAGRYWLTVFCKKTVIQHITVA